MKSVAGQRFFMLVKSNRTWLEDGVITPNAWGVFTYLGASGADLPEGVATTYGQLARVLRCSEKTVKMSLRQLRDLGAIEFDLKQGQRHPMRVRLGPVASRSGSRDPSVETSDALSDDASVDGAELRSEATSTPTSIDPAPATASISDLTSEASAQTETETNTDTETETLGVALGKILSSPARERADDMETASTEQNGYFLDTILADIEGVDAATKRVLLERFPNWDSSTWFELHARLVKARREARIIGTEIAYFVGICTTHQRRASPWYESILDWAPDGSWDPFPVDDLNRDDEPF
jgi:hypothetical protein